MPVFLLRRNRPRIWKAMRAKGKRVGSAHSATHSELRGAAFPSFRYSSYLCCFWTRALLAALLKPKGKEGNRMPSPRWLATLTIPMMAGTALVSSAAICDCHHSPGRCIPRTTARRGPHLATQHGRGTHRGGAPHLLRPHLGLDATTNCRRPPRRLEQEEHYVVGRRILGQRCTSNLLPRQCVRRPYPLHMIA